jgi:hypothetical protein
MADCRSLAALVVLSALPSSFEVTAVRTDEAEGATSGVPRSFQTEYGNETVHGD